MAEQACGIDGCALAEQVRAYFDLAVRAEDARRALLFVVAAHDRHGTLAPAPTPAAAPSAEGED